MNGWHAFVTIVGLAVVTVLTRGFFLIPDREIPLPEWVQRGLRHAPLAALAAVVAPEVLLTDGAFVPWHDPKLLAVAAASAYFFWRRGILGTIVVGMAVLLVLRLV